jgi:hypothetical protein
VFARHCERSNKSKTSLQVGAKHVLPEQQQKQNVIASGAKQSGIMENGEWRMENEINNSQYPD